MHFLFVKQVFVTSSALQGPAPAEHRPGGSEPEQCPTATTAATTPLPTPLLSTATATRGGRVRGHERWQEHLRRLWLQCPVFSRAHRRRLWAAAAVCHDLLLGAERG